MKNIQEKLKTFKVLFLDADGVFFDGGETRAVSKSGEVIISKKRSYLDGQGLSFLRALGIQIVFVTGEGEPLHSFVEKINSLPSVKNGSWKKVEIFSNKRAQGEKIEAITSWLTEHKLTFSDCAYMGDDVNDIPPMKAIQKNGLTVSPANVTRKVKPYADIITKNFGGYGAIREFVEMVLEARGIDESTLPHA